MKTLVTWSSLLAAARALKPYTTGIRLLFLHADGPLLTVSATSGDETASVSLDGAVSDGCCALPPDTLIKALTGIKPGRKATPPATVTLCGDEGRLTLTAADRPAISVDAITVADAPPAVTTQPAPGERPVTAGPAADWYDLIVGVTAAAGHDPTRPDLAVIRLLRDHPNVVLVAEATDRYRIHRGSWGQPDGDPVDLGMPAAAADRAVRLLRTLDPHAHLRIHADDAHLYWRTDRVRLATTTASRGFPNLEKIREDVLSATTTTVTLDRGDLLAAVTTAHQLATTNRFPRLRLHPTAGGGLQVVLHGDSAAPMYTAHVNTRQVTEPVPALTLDPAFARDALEFLDGDHLDIHATPDQLPIYLAGQRRHAIVMQIAA